MVPQEVCFLIAGVLSIRAPLDGFCDVFWPQAVVGLKARLQTTPAQHSTAALRKARLELREVPQLQRHLAILCCGDKHTGSPKHSIETGRRQCSAVLCCRLIRRAGRATGTGGGGHGDRCRSWGLHSGTATWAGALRHSLESVGVDPRQVALPVNA